MDDTRDQGADGRNAMEDEPLGSMTLYPMPESVPRARRWFRKLTARHGLVCSMDECLLMISELVTNAIIYGCAEEEWLVRIEWFKEGRALRVAVHNAGPPTHVRMRRAEEYELHGRGLCLVDALADSWQVGPSRFGGTVVSFVVEKAWEC